MQIKQIFETTILADDGKSEARFIVVPRAAYPRMPESQQGFHECGASLGFTELQEIDAGRLVDAFATCLAATEDRKLKAWIDKRKQGDVVTSERYAEHFKFAEILALAPVVPFQRNPLGLESVASIITGATSTGLGAYAGFVIGAGSPLIFVTVPAGMIIFGAAAGVARGIEEGLRDRLKKLISGT